MKKLITRKLGCSDPSTCVIGIFVFGFNIGICLIDAKFWFILIGIKYDLQIGTIWGTDYAMKGTCFKIHTIYFLIHLPIHNYNY